MDPNEKTLEDLAARVLSLEARSRRWKLATGLFAVLVAAVLRMGANPAESIEPPLIRARSVEAREFLLKDETGQVYARLSLNDAKKRSSSSGSGHSSQAVLEFYDEQGDVTLAVPGAPGMVPVR